MAVKLEYTGKLSDGRFFDSTSTKRVTIELDDNDLSVSELLEEFMNFTKAIGYNFELGDRFELVNDFKDSNNKYKDWGWDNPLSSGLSGEKPEIADTPISTDPTHG